MKAFAVLSLVVLVVVGGTMVSAAGASSARSLTWHLVEKDAGFTFIDHPPLQGQDAPPSLGDQFAFRSEMLTRAGKHAGWLNATCMVTNGGERGGGPCYGVFSFKGGQLMAMAQLSFASATTQVVIVGGTGVYRGASGNVASVSRGETAFSDDTFHLLVP
jgi:hypothetical protein